MFLVMFLVTIMIQSHSMSIIMVMVMVHSMIMSRSIGGRGPGRPGGAYTMVTVMMSGYHSMIRVPVAYIVESHGRES